MYNIKDLLSLRGINYNDLVSEKAYKLKWDLLDSVVSFTSEKLLELNTFGVLYDVDVDGLVSGKLIEEQLKKHGVIVHRHMNTQKKHGLNSTVIDWVRSSGIEFLFVVDAGSNDIEYHRILSEMGVYVVVLDHHECNRIEPVENVFIVNCVLDCNLPKLSGAGVCYRFIEGLDRELSSSGVSQYEAWIGLTVLSDQCSLLDKENRYYLDKLYENSDSIDLFRAFSFWGSKRNLFLFGVIPFLNVCIRMNEVNLAIELILSNNYSHIKKLIENNRTVLLERQSSILSRLKLVSKKISGESVNMYRLNNDDVEYSGLTGLLANQLMDETKKSVIVIYEDAESGLFKGSFRGRDSINKSVLESIGWVVKGHAQAAGVELSRESGSEVLKRTKVLVAESVKPHYDFELSERDVVRHFDFLREVARFNEYGNGDVETIKFKLNKTIGREPYKESRGTKRIDYNFLSFTVRSFTKNKNSASDIWIIEPLLDTNDIVLLRQ